eukprot:m.311815 g.311815  ORF g.311815 m.311815 type:complete len:478 (-) comp20231_c0_seq7:57-1490(-)
MANIGVPVSVGSRALLDGEHKVLVKYIGAVWSVSHPYAANHIVEKNAYAASQHKKEDVWVGVAFDSPVGKHGGKVNGIRYFTCKPKHGIFVRPHRLTLNLADEPAPTPSPSRSRTPRRTPRKVAPPQPPRVASLPARPPPVTASPSKSQTPLQSPRRRLRGPPRVAGLAKGPEEYDTPPRQKKAMLPHNVRVKKEKGPAQRFRDLMASGSAAGAHDGGRCLALPCVIGCRSLSTRCLHGHTGERVDSPTQKREAWGASTTPSTDSLDADAAAAAEAALAAQEGVREQGEQELAELKRDTVVAEAAEEQKARAAADAAAAAIARTQTEVDAVVQEAERRREAAALLVEQAAAREAAALAKQLEVEAALAAAEEAALAKQHAAEAAIAAADAAELEALRREAGSRARAEAAEHDAEEKVAQAAARAAHAEALMLVQWFPGVTCTRPLYVCLSHSHAVEMHPAMFTFLFTTGATSVGRCR